MVFFLDSSYIYNFHGKKLNEHNCQELVNEIKKKHSYQKYECIVVVFSILSVEELEDKNLNQRIREQYNEIRQKFIDSFRTIINCELFLSVKIDIAISKFNDKNISTIISLKQICDFSIVYSYSNSMLTQVISKNCASMIANVCSQELIKRFDFVHHYNSGINHILCNEMNEKNIILGVDINLFYNNSSPITQSRYFSSCIQNSKLATKSSIAHILFTIIERKEDFRSTHELISIQKALFKAQPLQVQNQKMYLNEYFSKLSRIKKSEYVE